MEAGVLLHSRGIRTPAVTPDAERRNAQSVQRLEKDGETDGERLRASARAVVCAWSMRIKENMGGLGVM